MADSQATTITVVEGDVTSPEPRVDTNQQGVGTREILDLHGFEPFYVLPTHLDEDEVHVLEEKLAKCGAPISQDIHTAGIIIGEIASARRAKFELQARQIETTLVTSPHKRRGTSKEDLPRKKRRKDRVDEVQNSSLGTSVPAISDAKIEEDGAERSFSQLSVREGESRQISSSGSVLSDGCKEEDTDPKDSHLEDRIRVIRRSWLDDSEQAGVPLSMAEYTVYEGQVLVSPDAKSSPPEVRLNTGVPKVLSVSRNEPTVTRRSFRTTGLRDGRKDRNAAAASQDLAGKAFMPSSQLSRHSRRRLLRETTSEHDDDDDIPDMPEWVLQNKIYACQRISPRRPPNEGFVELLKKIRLARTLTGDEIGVRAYSTSIASIIAFPRELSSGKEALQLPGCDNKIAALFSEYQEFGYLRAAGDVDKDPILQTINAFYNIWGVGATTAREWYYDRGFRDRDDLVEYGWDTLSRHQQIGVKFFDEFEEKMSRKEVESIADVVTRVAKKIVDEGIESIIVGGYRRGNKESGDVDVILTHRDAEGTKYLGAPLVHALEEAGWITHTLILAETNSARDQEALPLRSKESRKSGFDTLDKALVVWQDPSWPSKEEDLARNPEAKNPNPHRRVDIIIAPWKAIGCAVAGWTSGTTFQRDMRRYSRRVKGWKFDSSGVRVLGTGKWVDLERWTDPKTRAKSWQEAERRVFDGLGLQWVAPEDRNTG